MAEASDSADDTVLERARVREVTGIFYARENLDAAAYELALDVFFGRQQHRGDCGHCRARRYGCRRRRLGRNSPAETIRV
jgi:hypothetical protein